LAWLGKTIKAERSKAFYHEQVKLKSNSTGEGMKEEWKEYRLGELIELKRGYDLPSYKREAGSIPIVTSSGISDYHSVAKVKGPGVVTGRYGTIGEVFFVKNDFWPLNTTLYVNDFKGNNPMFFSYFLKCVGIKELNAAGAVPGINRNHLQKIKVKVPSLPTQRRIASILSAYDELIENNLKRIKLLEEMAQLTYEEWFVRMKFPGHETAVFDPETGLPEGWRKVKCIDAMEVLSGGTPKTTEEKFWNGDIEFYTPKDASSFCYTNGTEKSITNEGLNKCNSKLYPLNTVFITARGTVGKVNLASKSMAINQSCYALKGKNGVPQFYLYEAIKSITKSFKAVANGGVFDTIIVDTFRVLPFLLPQASLIESFVKLVKNNYSTIHNLLIQNERLKEARDLLLPRLMTGVMAV